MVLRVSAVAVGLALLWFGSTQFTVGGLLLMFCGLVLAVRAAAPPRPSLIAAPADRYSDGQMPATIVRSTQ